MRLVLLFVGHTEKECDTSEEIHADTVAETKKTEKRKASDEKEVINNVKKKKVNDSPESGEKKKEPIIENIKKAAESSEKKGTKRKVTTEFEVKASKSQLLKMHKKIKKLQSKPNGVVSRKKRTKKQQT